MSGDNTANTAKAQGYALLPSDKAHGATKNISDNAFTVSRDCRSKALATAPHLNPTHVAHLSHSSTPKRTKKPPCAQQESQCARRLKERSTRMGWLWGLIQITCFLSNSTLSFSIFFILLILSCFCSRNLIKFSILFDSDSTAFKSV